MRRFTATRRLAVACAAALAVGPFAAAATTADAAPAQPALPPAMVAAIARDLKLTPQQYLQRSDDAQRLGAFADTASRSWPHAFAGAWLDNTGQAVVALTSGAGRAAAAQAAAKAGFSVAPAANTQTALSDEKTVFDTWLSAQPRQIADQFYGVAVDTVHNRIAAQVDDAAARGALPPYLSGVELLTVAKPVAGEAVAPVPVAHTVAAAAPAVIGGQAYASRYGDHALKCSIGFNAVDGTGHPVNLTAGHCNPNIPSAGTPDAAGIYELIGDAGIGAHMGTFVKSVLGAQDYSIVRIDDGQAYRFGNNLIAGPGRPIPITGVAVPVVGMPVCKAGLRTGFSCGTVNAVDQSVQVGNYQMQHSFGMNICALPGDSGGPVVSGTRAVGISSASSVADWPICEIPEFLGLITGDVPQLFAQPVSLVLSANPGIHLR
jgi:hypothetical protein